MNRKADVVVVGSGAFGCNTAWHLRERGVDVVVLETASGPATQASRAAAGFVSSWSAVHEPAWGRNEWEMQRYGIEFYTRLAESCGRDIGYYPCGIAYIYLTEDGWDEVQPRIARARELGTQLEILTAERASEALPLLQFDATSGILFDPDSIRIRAAEAIPSLARQVEEMGARFHYNTHVTNLLYDSPTNDGRVRVRGVATRDGEFLADRVVVAAGAWTRPLLEQLNQPCPATPKTETRYTTKPLPGVGPEMPLLIFSAPRQNLWVKKRWH